MSESEIILRPARGDDHDFIRSLSPRLAGVAGLPWHQAATILRFQDAYIEAALARKGDGHCTIVATMGEQLLGFVHVEEATDGVSGEICGTVPLLAVTEAAQGKGVGRLLMQAAEDWARRQGYRLLHLEVFAANAHAGGFYENLGFRPDTLAMVKPLDG